MAVIEILEAVWMANYYTHFCVALPLSAEQAVQANELLGRLTGWLSARFEDEVYAGNATPEEVAMFERILDPEIGDDTGFTFDLRDGQVHLQDDGGGPNLDLAGNFIRELLIQHDIDEPILFEFGCTADKSRPGAFGGGAAFITKDSIDWLSTKGWLDERLQARNAITGPKP